ncbi:MAG: hypothetical protein OEO20_10495 [Gemmatimonadota bacterium]|nr:hypothetical protein [Gemmatimonadota bacterium]
MRDAEARSEHRRREPVRRGFELSEDLSAVSTPAFGSCVGRVVLERRT